MTAGPASARAPEPRPCVFCDILDGRARAHVVKIWPDAIAIVPLDPVVDGHLLVIPRIHVEDFTTHPGISAVAMYRAAELGIRPSNLITSAGPEATQTILHLHLHVVPRAAGDGKHLPWTSTSRNRG